MPGSRFRILRGKMMVISPDSEAETRPVNVVYDSVNDMFGIQLIGESELKGYCFFVPQQELKATRDRGTPSDGMPRV